MSAGKLTLLQAWRI